MRHIASIFKALSDETRLSMLSLLFKADELCVCDFMEVLDISQSKASRHLRYLVNAGLVDDRREAVWVYFRIAATPSEDATRVLEMLPSVLMTTRSAGLLERLDQWVETKSKTDGACASSEK